VPKVVVTDPVRATERGLPAVKVKLKEAGAVIVKGNVAVLVRVPLTPETVIVFAETAAVPAGTFIVKVTVQVVLGVQLVELTEAVTPVGNPVKEEPEKVTGSEVAVPTFVTVTVSVTELPGATVLAPSAAKEKSNTGTGGTYLSR
jgi:hypothetical protein